MGSPLIDITGQRFGRLVAIEKTERLQGHETRWKCMCDCGTTGIFGTHKLRSGKTKSCGCFSRERSTKHGLHGIPEYMIWAAMKRRCGSPDDKGWKDYGGRGIEVCQRWMDFKNFYADMGPRPSPKYSLDRIDNNGLYEPGNCRWADQITQHTNMRTSRFIEVDGKLMPLPIAARKLGLSHATLYWRHFKSKRRHNGSSAA